MEETQYVKATQDGIVRFRYNETPNNIAGLYTEGLETCFALILFGKNGITLLHDTHLISEETISKECELMGEIISWTIASNSQKNNSDDFKSYIKSLFPIIPMKKYRHYPDTNKYDEAAEGFVGIDTNGKMNFNQKPKRIISPLNEDKRHRIIIFNNFFSKYKEDAVIAGDLQFDGNNFSDCSELIISLEEMSSIAVANAAANNDPFKMLGCLKYYLEQYEPEILERIVAQERSPNSKRIVEEIDIGDIAEKLNRKYGWVLADSSQSKSIAAIQASNSPVHNAENVRSILGNITPGKKWLVNTPKGKACLELSDKEEAKNIISHFESSGYEDIKLMFKTGTASPVILLEPYNVSKLTKITPMPSPQNNLSKMLIS